MHRLPSSPAGRRTPWGYHGRRGPLDDTLWRQLELAGIGLTAGIFVILPKPPAATLPIAIFIPACVGLWSLYAAARVRAQRRLLERWGLRPNVHLRPLVAILAPLLGGLVLLGLGLAWVLGRSLLPPYLWLSLLLYPLWGLIQQWLVQALFVDNVRALAGASTLWLLGLGAIGFGAIHLAHPPLVVATALMGGVYVALFQRWRNLWPLACCHGWLGSLFYPWVLGINPAEQLVELLCP